MSPSAESIRSMIATLERDVSWLERWLAGDSSRAELKQFYGHQTWIDETDHATLVEDARDTVAVNRKYLDQLRTELAELGLAA